MTRAVAKGTRFLSRYGYRRRALLLITKTPRLHASPVAQAVSTRASLTVRRRGAADHDSGDGACRSSVRRPAAVTANMYNPRKFANPRKLAVINATPKNTVTAHVKASAQPADRFDIVAVISAVFAIGGAPAKWVCRQSIRHW